MDFGKSDVPEWSRYQNSEPVATQFIADKKVRVVGHIDDSFRFKKNADKRKFETDSLVVNKDRQFDIYAKEQNAKSNPMVTDSLVQIGALVEHSRFGIGKVINIEGTGENCKATVDFRNVGVKQLLMKFARLKVIR